MTKQVNYIGNGTTNKQFKNIIDVAICIDDAEQFFYEYEGKRYLKVQVAKRKKADKFGKTHSVSHFTPKAKLAE
jgi:hypothetical protein